MSVERLKKRALRDPEVKAEYESLQNKFALIDQLITMRSQAGLTQEQVAQRMSTQKSNVSRLERGSGNPSWATLVKYADACGFSLVLQAHKQ